MMYIYLNKNIIRVLHLKKLFLKQEETYFFEKKYETKFLEKNRLINTDLIASAVKEVIFSMQNQRKNNENQAVLIIPQDFFYFFRTKVPFDIAKEAIESFIIDKASNILSVNTEELIFEYFVKETSNEKIINFFALEKKTLEDFQQAFSLINIKIANIIPETLAYFKLFEKTLRNEKKENILYINLEKEFFYGYLFDNFGLLKEEIFYDEISEKNDYVNSIKKIITKLENEEKLKINRIIISGKNSENIRQDIFTKDVGVWTNPLKRIIPNFYDSYIKMLILKENKTFPILIYDASFGAFIFTKEENFSILKNQKKLEKKYVKITKSNLSIKEVFIFISSFIISFSLFLLIYNYKKIKISILPEPSKNEKQIQIKNQVSLPSLTPTPVLKKDQIKIQILNGSGIPGKASEIKEILRKKDYQEIITGNADNFNYKTTEIRIKKSKKYILNKIKEDLKDYIQEFKEVEISDNEVPDLTIIIGSDFK